LLLHKMIYKLAVALSFAAVSATLYTSDVSHQQFLWESFKNEFKRSYGVEEEAQRFNIFVANLKIADSRNELERKNGGNAVHGVTKFSDLSQSEFETHYLTSDPKLATAERVRVSLNKKPDTSASFVDWSGIYTTPVKDQGYCGSCWAFSATEQIESDAMRTLGKSWILSEEQIVQCDQTSFGCGGGWTEHAYNYVNRAGGLATESAYPYSSYQGTTGKCNSNAGDFVVKVSGYTTLASEGDMGSYVQSTGPLSVCVDANNWSSYTGGIMSVCGQSVDHCVQATGVDIAGGYWNVRNSWGTRWGESGYIRLTYGKNTCAIASDPTYASVA